MGFGRDQLRDKALLALEEAVQECRYGAVRQTLALRFSLAFLWSLRPSERRHHDDLWRSLVQDDIWRFSTADQALSAIYRQLGVERDHGLMMPLWKRAQERFCPFDARGLPVQVDCDEAQAAAEAVGGQPP